MIRFLIYFSVPPENEGNFVRMYQETYAPALRVQEGFLEVSLLRVFSPRVVSEIGGTVFGGNYLMTFDFDTEENRRRWAQSPAHELAWPAAVKLSTAQHFCGYDLLDALDGSSPGAP